MIKFFKQALTLGFCQLMKLCKVFMRYIDVGDFTLKQFFREPSHWFWFTTGWEDFDLEFLKEKE